MDLKSLDKAQKLYSQVKELDLEIINIEKLAGIMAEGGSVKFEISCEPKVNQEKVRVLDGDGSLIVNGNPTEFHGIYTIMMGCGTPTNKIEPPKYLIKESVTDSIGLQLLAVLLFEKQEKRKALINKLEQLRY